MENYVGKMRKLAEEKADDLENERLQLLKEKEKLGLLLFEVNTEGSNLADKVCTWSFCDE